MGDGGADVDHQGLQSGTTGFFMLAFAAGKQLDHLMRSVAWPSQHEMGALYYFLVN